MAHRPGEQARAVSDRAVPSPRSAAGSRHGDHAEGPLSLRVALSPKAAETATQTVAVVDATVKEVEGKMVPALAARLGTTPAAVNAEIAKQFPDVATGLAQWPRIRPGAADLAARQRATVTAFAAGDGAPFRTLPWLVIGPALVVALMCGTALVRRPQERARGEVPATPSTA
jgi:hypothetical protein